MDGLYVLETFIKSVYVNKNTAYNKTDDVSFSNNMTFSAWWGGACARCFDPGARTDPACVQRLKPNFENPISNFGFNCKLRHYSVVEIGARDAPNACHPSVLRWGGAG